MGCLPDNAEHLLFSVFPDSTGIINRNVRLFHRLGETTAHLLEHTGQLFTIVDILGTSEALDHRTRRMSKTLLQQKAVFINKRLLCL